jgi:hypothetical protein
VCSSDLTPEQRKSLLDAAESGFTANQSIYDNYRQQYTDLAVKSGVDPKAVVIGVRAADKAVEKKQAPKAVAKKLTLDDL